MNYFWLVLCLICAGTAMGQDNDAPSASEAIKDESYTADTMVVSAPQVTVAEVIEAITRRAERDESLLEDYEYTTLVTQVLRDDPGVDGGNYTLEEYALRHHFSRELGSQVAKLWERSRKYEDGEEVEDEIDEEMTAEFLSVQESVVKAMPFSSQGGDRYHYEILDRKLVGNNLIYKIYFSPKNKFEALPKGTIWVDYTNWVIRKFEAEMTDTVPFPMFLKSVPVYRMSQERFGEFWFPTEIYLRINLRKIPLLPIPDNVEVRVSLRDIVINGVLRSPEDTAPGTTGSDISDEEIEGGFWLSEEANNDSLSTYWGGIDREWETELSPEAIPITLAQVTIDSLNIAGTSQLQDLREGGLWRIKPEFVKAPGFNRTQGFVTRLGLLLEKQGLHNPSLAMTAGYAFGNKRPVFSGELEWPLVRSRWSLDHQPDDGREYTGRRYKLLSLQLSGYKDSGMFAGDGRRHTRSASSFFYGSDPNHYYEERGFDGDLIWRMTQGLKIHGGGGYMEHRPWSQVTDWNLVGRSLHPEGNMAADYLDDGLVRVGVDWQWGSLQVDGEATWHNYQNTPVMGGDGSLFEINVAGKLDMQDKWGNQWLLKGAHRGFDGTAPVQCKSWLGDYGTLRGYEAGVFTGDAVAFASLDARFGFDVFKAAKVPLLKNWGLQPIGFMDWGKTWDVGDGVVGPVDPAEGARGWGADIGFGFGKRFDVPGLGEFRNIRVYAAHPVGEASDGRGWRVLLAFEK